MTVAPPTTPFFDVFRAESEAIGARRALRAAPGPWTIGIQPRFTPDERGRSVPVPAAGADLSGLALSGGGVRSAAFCLGVLQGLDATVADDTRPQLYDAIDYLSTVSGGGYIGTALVSGLMQRKGVFPFTSKLDQEETIETQHVRDYSNYLVPEGMLDWVVAGVVLVRGLLINAMIFLSLVLAAACATVALNPLETDLGHFVANATSGRVPLPFPLTVGCGMLFLVVQIGYAIVSNRASAWWRISLSQRDAMGRLFALLGVLLAAAAILESQAFLLAALFEAAHAVPLAAAHRAPVGTSPLAAWFVWLAIAYPNVWLFLSAGVTATIAFGNKLASVAKATLGADTWGGVLQHWASRLALYAAAALVPLLIWVAYLAFSFWGIGMVGGSAPAAPASHPHTPEWLRSAHDALVGTIHAAQGCVGPYPPACGGALGETLLTTHSFTCLYGLAALVLGVVSLCVAPNATSLHGFYRDRLSRAFLWQKDRLDAQARLRDSKSAAFGGLFEGLRAGRPDDVDTFLLSSLKTRVGASWTPDVAFAPYLIVNAAVNLEGSKYLNRRGRNADAFLFSPLFVGSEATGYVPTSDMQGLDPNLNLGTAMAISGAAASANMGASTIRVLTFSLAALNVRLGYWLPNPRVLQSWQGRLPWTAKIGPWYFARETFGLLDEWTRNVYLTDGGHFDNLGLYELLKRRCAVVIAVDAEADPFLNFESLVRLERYARIDTGVRIDLPWETLRRFSKTVTTDLPHGPSDDPGRCTGPHVALGRIDYGAHGSGVLIYIKACISGDENDLIRDYRRRNASFPHETTLDQFFSEEQFEVYRALGFHAATSFFSGRDHFAMLHPPPLADWHETVRAALTRLNVPTEAIDRIVERQQDGPRPVVA